MKFDLINPSDTYHFEAKDLEIAAVMVCVLGGGKYAAEAMGEDKAEANNVPLFLFGGHDEWFTRKFGMRFEDTVEHCIQHRRGDLAKSFASVTLANGPRSSLNDIGGRAHALAEGLSKTMKAA